MRPREKGLVGNSGLSKYVEEAGISVPPFGLHLGPSAATPGAPAPRGEGAGQTVGLQSAGTRDVEGEKGIGSL